MEARRSASPTSRLLYFDAFSFDPDTGRLTRDGAELPLGRTAAKVLAVLLTHRQRAVTQEEIRRAVWAARVVDRGAVKGYISDLRAILQDDPRAPRFLASTDGGYRFIAAVMTHSPVQRAAKRDSLVGRDDVLRRLRRELDRALEGHRRFVFVTGEPGIGKTTAVEVFLEEAEATAHVLVGRGQCVEHSGPGMAYLPLLDALERTGRGGDGPRVITVLRQHAPTWLAQLPAAVAPGEPAALDRSVRGATQERRFRELARALELLTADLPLVLWIEDLHWCDPETIALLSFLARRTEPARLCIVGTYRPAEVIVHQHPVKALTHELQAMGIGVVMPLPFLSAEAIEAYVRRRFGAGAELPVLDLARMLQHRTEGNPLFMVRMLDHAVAQGTITENADGWRLTTTDNGLDTLFPASLLDLIAKELAQLADGERQVLEAASVVGEEFTLEEVSAALQLDIDLVDQYCEALVRQRQLLHQGEPEHWPDGTVTIRARFGHALHQHAIYDQLLLSKKLLWHGRIAARKAAAWEADAAPIAAELAVHFRRAGDVQQAVRYHVLAGQVASGQQAHQVAVAQYAAALMLLARVPETPARAEQEVRLQVAMGVALMATKGYAAPEVEQAYARALVLCHGMSEAPQLVPTLYGLWAFHLTRGEYLTAQPLAERMLRLADQVRDREYLTQAHQALGLGYYFQGEFATACEHLLEAMPPDDRYQQPSPIPVYGHDPRVVSLFYRALALWMLGYPDRARQHSNEALGLARQTTYAPTVASGLYGIALIEHWRGELSSALSSAQEALSFATQHGLPFWIGLGTCLLGWVMARLGQHREGMARQQEGLVFYQATGARLGFSQRFVALAETHGYAGQYAEGLAALAEVHAWCKSSGELLFMAEATRLKGELVLQQGLAVSPRQHPGRRAQRDTSGKSRRRVPSAEAREAEACFHHALDTARRQQARSWELRAALSLADLWTQQGRAADARRLLGATYGWFTEGFETADLLAAKRRLAELA